MNNLMITPGFSSIACEELLSVTHTAFGKSGTTPTIAKQSTRNQAYSVFHSPYYYFICDISFRLG